MNKKYFSVFTFLVAISSISITNAENTKPEIRDAKKETVVTITSSINNHNDYISTFSCGTGEWKPITSDVNECYIMQGQTMYVKVSTVNAITGLPAKTMQYSVQAHNSTESYICDDKGAIERGYAATVSEIILGQSTKIADVCTTVDDAGDNKTRGKFTVTETAAGVCGSSSPQGMCIEFKNTGGSWAPTGEYPNTTGPYYVDFSKLDSKK